MLKVMTRRDFLRWGMAGTLVGGVSLLVLKPRGKKCDLEFACEKCGLDPMKDEGCPRYGEEEKQVAPTPSSAESLKREKHSSAGEGAGCTGEDNHA
jgi:hypothetical protein